MCGPQVSCARGGGGGPLADLPADRSPSAETQPLLEAPPVVDDTSSCQFPEEERGTQLSEDTGEDKREDKGPLGNLWV